MQKSKFTEIFNICWKHVPFILCRSSQFDQMFYISVNFDFCIMKKLWDLAHEKLVNILGGHHVWTNIHGCQPCPGNCHLCTEISKRRTIIHTTVIFRSSERIGCTLHFGKNSSAKWYSVEKDKWYFVTKIVLTYCEKKLF